MQGPTLLKSCPEGPVQPLFEIERSAPFDDVGEQIAVEGGVVREQLREVERPFGRHEIL